MSIAEHMHPHYPEHCPNRICNGRTDGRTNGDPTYRPPKMCSYVTRARIDPNLEVLT